MMQTRYLCIVSEIKLTCEDNCDLVSRDMLNIAFLTKISRTKNKISWIWNEGCKYITLQLYNAKSTGKRKYREEAKTYLKLLRDWVTKKRAINISHKLMVLNAEMMTLGRKSTKKTNPEIMAAFDKAISSATKLGSSKTQHLQRIWRAVLLSAQNLPTTTCCGLVTYT